MKKKLKILALTLSLFVASQPLTACAETAGLSESEGAALSSSQLVQMIDPGYSNRDLSGTWDESEALLITLDGSSVAITEPGTYILSGIIADGQVTVEVTKEDKVQLVLNGVDITSFDGPAIHVKQADKVFITLADGSVNELADGSEYTLTEGEDEPNGALYSKADLTINGSGSLTVNGNYKHGVSTKDDLVITDGAITVNSVSNGLRGKDSVAITGGVININSGGDGIKSTNAEKEGKGWISIDGGVISITAEEGDGIQAETQLQITGGEITILAGGGAENAPASSSSSFGFGIGPGGMRGGTGSFGDGSGGSDAQSGDSFDGESGGPRGFDGDRSSTDSQRPEIAEMREMPENFEGRSDEFGAPSDFGGESGGPRGFGGGPGGMNGMDDRSNASENSAEDDESSTKGLKARDTLYITAGTINCDSADDALHSDNIIVISGGDLTLKTGDDGIHADNVLLIEDGVINITESYEGLESSVIGISGGEITLKASDDGVNASDGSSGRSVPGQGDDNLYIRMTGGMLVIDAGGDGIDSNGNIFIEGGTIIVNGPTGGADVAIDYDGNAEISGGTVIASGPSGSMLQNFGSDSTQPSLLVTFSQKQSAGTQVTLKDSSGSTVVSHTPTKDYQSVVISSPDMKQGSTYTLSCGDTDIITIQLTDVITSVNDSGEAISTFNSGGFGGGGFGGGFGGGRGTSSGGSGSDPASQGGANGQDGTSRQDSSGGQRGPGGQRSGSGGMGSPEEGGQQ